MLISPAFQSSHAGLQTQEVWKDELLRTRQQLLDERTARQRSDFELAAARAELEAAGGKLRRAEQQDAALLKQVRASTRWGTLPL